MTDLESTRLISIRAALRLQADHEAAGCGSCIVCDQVAEVLRLQP